MNKSEGIGNLATAFALAQGQIKMAKHNDKNYFGRSYANLSAILEAVKEPLASNGLSVTQLVDPDPEFVKIETVLLHKSGEWISTSITMKPAQSTPQAMGSTITYARRYSLSALLGVASEEDDDGNAGTGLNKKPEQNTGKPGKPPVTMPQETKKNLIPISEAFTYPINELFDVMGLVESIMYSDKGEPGKEKWVTHFVINQLSGAPVKMEVNVWGKCIDQEIGTLLGFPDCKAFMAGGERKFLAPSVKFLAGAKEDKTKWL